LKLQKNDLSHNERLSLVGEVAHLDALIAQNIKVRLQEVHTTLDKCEKDVQLLYENDLKRSYKSLYKECKQGYRDAMKAAKDFSELKKSMREHKEKLFTQKKIGGVGDYSQE
jgi:hypothetical protein